VTRRGPVRVADAIRELLRELKIRSVVVPAGFPLGLADDLRRLGVRVKPVEPMYPERLYKTAGEIREIEKVMRATERAMRAAIDLIAASRIRGGYLVHGGRRLTAERVRATINTTLLERGCLPKDTIVAPGLQGCDPHDRGSGPIRAHQPVIIDIFPRSESSGYFADMTRTVVRGRASERVKRMFAAVRDAQRLALSLIRHGTNGALVHRAIHDLFERRGFETGRTGGRMQGFFHGTGHGLGLEIHEPPRIGGANAILEKGMVVTVEPGLYYVPDGGVRIEDTVRVTQTGIRNLTRFPKFLEV